MDTVVLSSLLNGALLLVCLGLLLSFCVSCGQSWRQTSIHQFIQDDHPNEVYNPGDFRVVRPMPTVVTSRYTHVPRPGVSNPAISLTPAPSSLRSPWQEPERRPSYTPTEDDDDSYVNQDSDGDHDVDGDKQGYIEVLPDDIPSKPKDGSQPSLSSGNDEIYVNVEQESDSENYINMPEHEKGGLTSGKSQESMESDGNGSTDYVNTSPK
nr:uncharacterized protein LOC111833748 isoform X1 [Paramormyrops kingsleyae]